MAAHYLILTTYFNLLDTIAARCLLLAAPCVLLTALLLTAILPLINDCSPRTTLLIDSSISTRSLCTGQHSDNDPLSSAAHCVPPPPSPSTPSSAPPLHPPHHRRRRYPPPLAPTIYALYLRGVVTEANGVAAALTEVDVQPLVSMSAPLVADICFVWCVAPPITQGCPTVVSDTDQYSTQYSVLCTDQYSTLY